MTDTIRRSEVLRRAAEVWPREGVAYDQGAIHQPDGYRQDCSGYVSMCWAISPGNWGGPNTATLVSGGYMHPIGVNVLRPGDAVGRCGPGSEGNAGHVRLFAAWYNSDPADSHYYCWEQAGGESGPHHRLVDWTPGHLAYRYAGIVDDPAPVRPYPLSYPPDVFADVDGPNSWHGGFYAWERQYVAMIQRAVIRAGCVPGVTDPAGGWVDGIFDGTADGTHPTTDAVKRYQNLSGLVADGLVGPATWSDMARRGCLS